MKDKILFVVNPISGDKDKNEMIDLFTKTAEKNDFEVIQFDTTGENDCYKVEELLSENDFNRVVVTGGDGTIKMVVEAILNTNILPLGIIPGGSANGLAVSLNIPVDDIEKAIQKTLENKKQFTDIILQNNEIGIHLSDIGFNAQMIKSYESSERRGFLGYAVEFIKTAIDFEGVFGVTISQNNKEHTHNVVMVVIANANKYGTGMVINPEGKIDDKQFELVLVKNLGIKELALMYEGDQSFDPENIEIIKSDGLEIKMNKPIHFQVDGEYIGEIENLELKIHEKQIPFLV